MTDATRDRVGRFGRWSLAVGVAAAAVCALAAAVWPRLVAQAYLPAFLFAWGLSVGCLGLGLLDRLTGGRWGRAGRPFVESGLRLVPLSAALFVPLALGLAAVYPWTAPDFFAGFEEVAHRKLYLTPDFFLLRAAGYFLLWSLLALAAVREWAVSGPSMALLVVSVTWAAMDWVMSIDPWFASSILGALIGTGAAMSALAAVCVGVCILPGRPTLPPDAPGQTLGDLGSLLLAFVMLWTYMAFSQFLIIWSGNLPEEAAWYVRRGAGGWQWLIIALAAGGFALPFAALLSRDLKRKPPLLAAVAGLVLLMNYLALCWQTLPEYSPGRFSLNPFALVTPLATGGLWFAALARLALRRPELAPADPSDGGSP